ncbi:MAG: hypothetical protein IIA45_11845 [Bacteroidetes bacterium]|nr:hypothetical protein [Bacteroidota bacterium]
MKKFIYLIIVISTLSCSNQEKNLPDNFDFGKTEAGSYVNDFFEMEIFFNPDWVIQDKQQMNDLIDAGGELFTGDDKNLKSAVEAAMVNTAYLLTIFKHELGSAVEFNPSFMVIAENTKNAPGIKNGGDYLFHSKKLLEQTQMGYYFEKDVIEKTIGKSTFHVMEAKLDYMDMTIIQEYMELLHLSGHKVKS